MLGNCSSHEIARTCHEVQVLGRSWFNAQKLLEPSCDSESKDPRPVCLLEKQRGHRMMPDAGAGTASAWTRSVFWDNGTLYTYPYAEGSFQKVSCRPMRLMRLPHRIERQTKRYQKTSAVPRLSSSSTFQRRSGREE